MEGDCSSTTHVCMYVCRSMHVASSGRSLGPMWRVLVGPWAQCVTSSKGRGVVGLALNLEPCLKYAYVHVL